MRRKLAMLVAIAGLAAPIVAVASDAIDEAAFSPVEILSDGAGGCLAEPAFIMPTTGVPFTLPPDIATPNALDCAVPIVPAPVRPPAPSLFRMAALPVGDVAPKQKWERARLEAVTARPGPWDELLAQADRFPQANLVGMVNQWVNWHVRYRDDSAGDEWATAPVTLSRGFGDCEDFAVAKMGLLLALGIPSDDLYLVLLRDRQKVQHAVLVVNRGGQLYVLDNRTDTVLPAQAIDDYTPILSFSGSFAWIYGERAG